MRDLLAGAVWSVRHLSDSGAGGESFPARVPGTAARAVADHAGASAARCMDYDAGGWEFSTTFEATADEARRGWVFRSDGIATVSEILMEDVIVGGGDSAFGALEFAAPVRAGRNRLAIVCRGLPPQEPGMRRPRWKSSLVPGTGLRHVRTPLIGRIPWAGTAPVVGPWAPLSLTPADAVTLTTLRTTVSGDRGTIELALRTATATGVTVEVARSGSTYGLASTTVRLEAGAETAVRLDLPRVERWNPATSGTPVLYDLVVTTADGDREVRRIGFRTIAADRTDGRFALVVNDAELFARGVVWAPLDPLALGGRAEDYRAAIADLVRAGVCLIRIGGTGAYEQPAFYEECDRQGVLVWQDAMLATLDPPDDEEWLAGFDRELETWLRRLAAHPCVAVIAGGNETEQQPYFWGLPEDRRRMPVLDTTIPAAVRRWIPGAVHVRSSPSSAAGAPSPVDLRSGVCHYFGVGAYRRPLEDARTSGVRFASECLAFATPPEPWSIVDMFGSEAPVGDPAWTRGIAADPGATWTFASTAEHYAARFFGAFPSSGRLDHHRAAIAHAIFETLVEWRRPASPCAGALVLSSRDLALGAGFGLVDARGRRKSSWYAVAAASAPIALAFHDEGLNGLELHLFADRDLPVAAQLAVVAYGRQGAPLERAALGLTAVESAVWRLDELFGGFRDLENTWGFGPLQYDVIEAVLRDATGGEVARTAHLLGGPRRPADAALGLAVRLESGDNEDDGTAAIVTTKRLATFVALDAPGFQPADNYFHLPPGGRRRIPLEPVDGMAGRPAEVTVRALNDGGAPARAAGADR